MLGIGEKLFAPRSDRWVQMENFWKELIKTNKTFKISMKLLALFLAVLTAAYLLPFSVLAENVANDTVIRGEI